MLCCGFSKTTLRLDDSLEGFMRLRKSCDTKGNNLLQQKDTEQPREKAHVATSKKNPVQASKCSLSVEFHSGSLNSPSSGV